MSFIDDLNNLDPNNPGVWPAPVKAVVFAVVFAGILFAAWKLDIVGQREVLAGKEKEVKEQVDVLDLKQKKAATPTPGAIKGRNIFLKKLKKL